MLAGGRDTPVVKLTGVGTLLIQRDEGVLLLTTRAITVVTRGFTFNLCVVC